MTESRIPQSAESPQKPNGRKTAVYARTSTRAHQDPETQLLALREYCGARGLEISGEYVDVGQGGAKERRPELDRLMVDARQRRFDAVLVARFDRFARSVRHLVMSLEEFNALGIDFISVSEAIDTSTPMGKMVFTVIAAVAELERALIRERVAMGLQRAKAKGKKLGRPRVRVSKQRLKALHDSGLSLRKIADKLGIGKTTVAELLKKLDD